MPRNDQNAFESLRNVLAEGIHKSEDLLITVSFWKERFLAWAGNFCMSSLSGILSEIFVSWKHSFINHNTSFSFFFFFLRMQREAPAHTQKLYCKCKYCSCLKTKLCKQKRSLTTNVLWVDLFFFFFSESLTETETAKPSFCIFANLRLLWN